MLRRVGNDAAPTRCVRGSRQNAWSRNLRAAACLLLAGGALAVARPAAAENNSFLGANPKLPALKSSANKSQQQLALARLCERRNESAKANEIYTGLVKSGSKEVQGAAHHRLAVMAAKDDRVELADHHFRQAMALLPNDATLLSDAGYFFYLRDKYGEAEKLLRRAIDRDSKNQAARNNLGLVLGRQGRFQDSYAAFRDAGPDAQATNNLAFVYAQKGDVQKAEQLYSRAVSLNPKMKPAAESLVQIAQHKDQSGRANPALRRNSDQTASSESPRSAAPSASPAAQVSRRDVVVRKPSRPTPGADSGRALAMADDSTAGAKLTEVIGADGKPLGRLVPMEPIKLAVGAPRQPASDQTVQDPAVATTASDQAAPAAKPAPLAVDAAPAARPAAPPAELVTRIPIVFGPKRESGEANDADARPSTSLTVKPSTSRAVTSPLGGPAAIAKTSGAKPLARTANDSTTLNDQTASTSVRAAARGEVRPVAATAAPKRPAAATIVSATPPAAPSTSAVRGARPRQLDRSATSAAQPALGAADRADSTRTARKAAKYSEVVTASDETQSAAADQASESAKDAGAESGAATSSESTRAPGITAKQRSSWASSDRTMRQPSRSTQSVRGWAHGVIQGANKPSE